MTNETLSSKIHADLGDGGLIFTSDVKDFIQKLKEDLEKVKFFSNNDLVTINRSIDKLAGDALIHSPPTREGAPLDTPEDSSGSMSSGNHSPVYKRSKDTTPDGQPLRGAGSSGAHSQQEICRNCGRNKDNHESLWNKHAGHCDTFEPSGTHSPQENLRGCNQKQEVKVLKVLKVLKDAVDALVGEGSRNAHVNSQLNQTADTSDKIKFHCTCERGKCICNKSLNILGGTTVTDRKGFWKRRRDKVSSDNKGCMECYVEGCSNKSHTNQKGVKDGTRRSRKNNY